MADDREEWIRRRAYDLWEAQGRPHGRHDEHWSAASDDAARADAPEPADVAVADTSQAALIDPSDATKHGGAGDDKAVATIADSELAEAAGISTVPIAAPAKPKRAPRTAKSATPARARRK